MAKRKFHGSCDCGKVKIEAELDLSKGTGKCNCTTCTKFRWWGIHTDPASLRVTEGESELTDYHFDLGPVGEVHHPFCKHCGTHVFGHGDLKEIGGKYVTISVAALDDVDPQELVAAPTLFMDGRKNQWERKPDFTAHL